MCWNDGYERRKFEARQKKQAEEYRALGMTEEQIKEKFVMTQSELKKTSFKQQFVNVFLL